MTYIRGVLANGQQVYSAAIMQASQLIWQEFLHVRVIHAEARGTVTSAHWSIEEQWHPTMVATGTLRSVQWWLEAQSHLTMVN